MEDRKVIEALQFREKSLRERWDNVRPSMTEAARWIDPARGRHLDLGENADRQKQLMLPDSTHRKAYRILKSGLMGGLSSPSRPWFKLKLEGYEKPSHDMQVWLDEVQRRAYLILAGSNAYNALSQCYGDLGLFGCYAGVIRSSFEDVIHIQSFPVGAYVFGENDNGQVDTLHWTLKLTVRQLVEQFGTENVSDNVRRMWERNQLNDRVEVRAAIEPRFHRDPMKNGLATNMPVAVYYREAKVHDKLLHAGGLEYPGILAPRWETVVDDPWPISSPGRDALGDIKQLQAQQRDRDTAVQMGYKPPLMGPAMGVGFSYLPGAYNAVTVADLQKGGPRPVFQHQTNINHLDHGIAQTQARVSEAFFADLFRMASEYGMAGAKDVTATAIAEMKEEKLITLGPVLESLDRGLLSPLIQGVYHYMQEADLVPPPPDEAVGAKISVEFISLLAQAQRAIGVAAIERTIGFAGTLAQMQQGVLDNLDGDVLLREFADQIGFPASGFRSPEAVEAQRDAAAQQAQQQQMMEMAQPMAQAANLISEANARGQESLAAQGLL